MRALCVQVADEEVARRDALARKADAATVSRQLEGKVDTAQLAEALAGKADARALEAARRQGESAGAVAARVAALQDEVQSKASSKVRDCIHFFNDELTCR